MTSTHTLTFAVTDDAPADLVIDAVSDGHLTAPQIAKRTRLSYDEVLGALPFLVHEGYVTASVMRGGRVVYGPGRIA